MENNKTEYQNIDEYISQFPGEIQAILQKIREIVHETAPEAGEKISYQMPTFYMNGNLVHFAAFKNILASIRHQAVRNNSEVNCLLIKERKDRCNSL